MVDAVMLEPESGETSIENNALNDKIDLQVRRILDVYDRARMNIDSGVIRDVIIPTIVVIGD